jgi:hypothetical protein
MTTVGLSPYKWNSAALAQVAMAAVTVSLGFVRAAGVQMLLLPARPAGVKAVSPCSGYACSYQWLSHNK